MIINRPAKVCNLQVKAKVMLIAVIALIAEVARITNAGGYIEYGRVNGKF
jgi:hypothetical protein